MTREEAIANLNMISVAFVEPVTKEQRKLINDTFDMAIQALSQEPICDRDCEHCTWTECPIEPCTDTVSIRKDILKCRVENIVAYNVEWLKKHWQMEMDIVCGVKPCEDAVSRAELLKAIDTWDKFGYTETGCFVREPKGDYVAYIHYDDVIKCIKGMPSVNPQPCDDGNNLCSSCTNIGCEFQSGIVRTKCAFYMPPRIESDNCGNYVVMQPPITHKSGKWIALVTRPMTNEEREYYSEQLDYCDGDAAIYNCPLPEEGQEVLITTCTGGVLIDTFFNDYDGCGFEGYDIEDVKAWMPLPKPYETQESEEV